MYHNQISNTIFSFIDTETTALCPSEYGRVCEIAVVKTFPNGKRQSFSRLINPQVSISPNATAVHKITNKMVASEPAFDAVVPELMSLFSDSVLVFHNAAFDIPFLTHEFACADLHFRPEFFLDTLKYARKHGNFISNSLGNIACELGFSSDGWHRALADVKMTEKIFFYFLDKFRSAGVKTVGELIELQKGKIRNYDAGSKNAKTNIQSGK